MSINCPVCLSNKSYVKDVDGEHLKGGLLLILTHYCICCKHQWNTEQEAYVNQKRIM